MHIKLKFLFKLSVLSTVYFFNSCSASFSSSDKSLNSSLQYYSVTIERQILKDGSDLELPDDISNFYGIQLFPYQNYFIFWLEPKLYLVKQTRRTLKIECFSKSATVKSVQLFLIGDGKTRTDRMLMFYEVGKTNYIKYLPNNVDEFCATAERNVIFTTENNFKHYEQFVSILGDNEYNYIITSSQTGTTFGRICRDDLKFISYTSIKLDCPGSKLAIRATLFKSSVNLTLNSLYITFWLNDTASEVVCSFSMKKITEKLNFIRDECAKNGTGDIDTNALGRQNVVRCSQKNVALNYSCANLDVQTDKFIFSEIITVTGERVVVLGKVSKTGQLFTVEADEPFQFRSILGVSGDGKSIWTVRLLAPSSTNQSHTVKLFQWTVPGKGVYQTVDLYEGNIHISDANNEHINKQDLVPCFFYDLTICGAYGECKICRPKEYECIPRKTECKGGVQTLTHLISSVTPNTILSRDTLVTIILAAPFPIKVTNANVRFLTNISKHFKCSKDLVFNETAIQCKTSTESSKVVEGFDKVRISIELMFTSAIREYKLRTPDSMVIKFKDPGIIRVLPDHAPVGHKSSFTLKMAFISDFYSDSQFQLNNVTCTKHPYRTDSNSNVIITCDPVNEVTKNVTLSYILYKKLWQTMTVDIYKRPSDIKLKNEPISFPEAEHVVKLSGSFMDSFYQLAIAIDVAGKISETAVCLKVLSYEAICGLPRIEPIEKTQNARFILYSHNQKFDYQPQMSMKFHPTPEFKAADYLTSHKYIQLTVDRFFKQYKSTTSVRLQNAIKLLAVKCDESQLDILKTGLRCRLLSKIDIEPHWSCVLKIGSWQKEVSKVTFDGKSYGSERGAIALIIIGLLIFTGLLGALTSLVYWKLNRKTELSTKKSEENVISRGSRTAPRSVVQRRGSNYYKSFGMKAKSSLNFRPPDLKKVRAVVSAKSHDEVTVSSLDVGKSIYGFSKKSAIKSSKLASAKGLSEAVKMMRELESKKTPKTPIVPTTTKVLPKSKSAKI